MPSPTVVSGPGHSSSSSVRYIVRNNPDLTFDLPAVTPSASVTAVNEHILYFTNAGDCSVKYTAEPMPVNITSIGPGGIAIGGTGPGGPVPGGPTPGSSSSSNSDPDAIVIGQKLKVQIESSASSALDVYTWLTPSGGAPFSNFNANDFAGQYTPFTPPVITSNTMECYFAKGGATTITCLYFNALSQELIPLTLTLNVKTPINMVSLQECGKMKFVKGGDVWNSASGVPPDSFKLFGVRYGTKPLVGMWAVNTLLDPVGFGRGEFGYVQIRNRKSTQTAPHNDPDEVKGLDGGFPYYELESSNGIDAAIFDDTPDFPSVQPFPFTGDFKGRYRCYLIYKPADDPAGPSVYVPIKLIEWTADGICSTVDGLTWTPTPNDRGSGITSITSYPNFPRWPIPVGQDW